MEYLLMQVENTEGRTSSYNIINNHLTIEYEGRRFECKISNELINMINNLPTEKEMKDH